MNTDAQLRDDVAFLRSLAETGGRTQWTGGAAFFAGGGLYGLQCLVQWAQAERFIVLSPLATFLFVTGITVAFAIVLTSIILHGRRTQAVTPSLSNKAFTMVFSAAGLSNLALVAVFASVAIPRKSLDIWELYPAALFALQGGAWYCAYVLRRRLWLMAVSVCWFVSAIVLAQFIGTATYVLIVALALFAFMALPGLYMMHLARIAE
jgi:hypothetical protein